MPPGRNNPPTTTVRRPDGRGTITRVGIGRHPITDLYHFLLTASWRNLLLGIVVVWLGANGVFALLYLLVGDGIAGARPGSFVDAYFFSVQTMATIGYGGMAPRTFPAHVIVTAEALTGMLAQAMSTGLIFAKFARPTARVLFSKVVAISVRDGVPSLMFRMANERSNQIVEASLHVAVLRNEVTKEGERLRRVSDLALLRSTTPAFNLTWTAVHAITPDSPLHGVTPESLAKSGTQIIISIMGTDETLAQTVHARHVYSAGDVRFGVRFVDILTGRPDGDAVVDYTKFHDVLPIEPQALQGTGS